ncbi:NUDIX hydrolase [Microbacterium sp. Root61]|uniref:NUDIX hydrolase n=1 Tax=Microbacterium sp. Root61 TaxID=1736570 RepID=UPI0006F8E488|nr:CoA pyrophosphatase [Microbacterium sp. Root61]KRA23615.1 NUDIX hydrolase [Microbacterium sp. Root61]
MLPDDISVSARAQLVALAERSETEPPRPEIPRRFQISAGDEARPAAVLMLFGVLDELPSDHAAQAQAVSRDLDVLLLARASTLRSHAGQIAFPGGRIDPDDDGPVAAALREAREETGLDPDGVEILGSLEVVPLAYSLHLVTPVLAWWRHPSPIRVVDVAESAAVFRMPVADLLDPANRGVTVMRRDGQTWRGPAFLVPHVGGERLVWGFTAMLLDGLFDRLGWTEPWDKTREVPLDLDD